MTVELARSLLITLSFAIVAWERSVYLPVIENAHQFDWRVKPLERKKPKAADSRTRCMAFWREGG
jgi:hypothetical protein